MNPIYITYLYYLMQFFSNNKKLFLAIFVVLIMVFSSAFAVSNLFVGNQNINHPISNMARNNFLLLLKNCI